ncbi:MAG: hypothetical protein ACRYFS_22700 [Janthinobacterium lividum]
MMLTTPATNRSIHFLTVALFAGTLLSVPLSSQADVTLTARQSVTSGQTPAAIQAIKLFYQGPDTRLEVAGAPVLLYDGKAGTVYGLDPVQKTYYLTVPMQVEPTDFMPAGVGSQVTQDTKLDLHQTDQTMTLAGVTTHQYTVSGTITFTRNRPQGGRRGGGGHHRSGGGGFPMLTGSTATIDQEGGYGDQGNGGGQGGGRSSSLTMPQWTISGDIWLADTLKFPSKENTLSAAQLAAAAAGPFQQPLADALDKHKGLPLLARITVIRIPALSGGKAIDQYGGVIEGQNAAAKPISTATTLTIQSISSAPLDPRIFQTPISYALVAAPQTPYDPGTPPSALAP